MTKVLSRPLSRPAYLTWLVLILLLGAWLRLHLLEADAPLDLSPSQELNLDGPVTIAAGRDRAVFGDWVPFPGPLQPYRYYPAMNWLAFGFFSFLGVGYWQANLISVVTGFLSIVFVAAFAREQFGRRASLFSSLFMAVNYVYIIYNRDPMAYTTLACGMMLSLFFWGKGLRNPAWFVFSGLAMAFTTLFVKLPAVAFAPAALLGFVALWWPNKRKRAWHVYAPILLFGAGALLISAIWFWTIYLPAARVVSQAYYVRTFSSNYTFADNLRFAVQSLLLFGVDFGFNLRMLPLFALSHGYLLYRVGQQLSHTRPRLKAAEILILAYLAGMIGMLLISGIRPLRYQILLIPPMALVAALALDAWLRRPNLPLPEQFGRLFPVLVQLLLAYLAYQLLAAGLILSRTIKLKAGPVDAGVAPSVPDLYVLLAAGLILAIFGTLLFLWRTVQQKRFHVPLFSPSWRVRTLIIVLLLSSGADLYQYWTWARDPQFSIVEASRVVSAELEPEGAILGGTYAYTLALEGRLPAVWFYGHSPAPAIEATRFTHLAMEIASPLAGELTNDQKIRDNMPELMSDATPWKTLDLRGYQVRIYDIHE